MDTYSFWSMFSNSWKPSFTFFLLFYAILLRTTDAQMNCNNCGNNCGGCGVTFPDPPPIILQPPAPPPNNTCCCDCANNGGGNGGNAFNGNCGGCGSNCGNSGGCCDCCGGGGGGNCCCGGGGGGNCCCGGNGGGGNINNCCSSGPLTNQNPNTPGGPQSRTNRCCQVICSKGCCCGGNSGGGNSGGCCCQPCCQQCCQPCCCQPCCCGGSGGGGCCCQCCGQLCNSFCTPCCCNPCSGCDCCHDCYPNDFDCEIGYKRRRRRQIFAPHPAFHRFRSYPRRFYVLPLPLPPAQEDLPPRARGPGTGRRSHTHHHFHHHYFHCCPCACCNCGCNGQANGPGFNSQGPACGGSNCGNNIPNFADTAQPQWPTFGPQQEGCFGSPCSQPPAEPQPCTSGNNFPPSPQQDFYNNNFGNAFGASSNNFGGNMASGPQFGNGFGSQFGSNFDCPGCGQSFGGGYRRFQRLLQRRKRQLVTPAFNGDKVLNFLIPMFYKKPDGDAMKEKPGGAASKCANKRPSRSFPCSLPIQPDASPVDFQSRPLQHQAPCNMPHQIGRDTINETKCCCQCCACSANKKRRRKKRRK